MVDKAELRNLFIEYKNETLIKNDTLIKRYQDEYDNNLSKNIDLLNDYITNVMMLLLVWYI